MLFAGLGWLQPRYFAARSWMALIRLDLCTQRSALLPYPAGAQGGAIAMLTTKSLSLINSTISYCKAQNGGGVFVQNTTLAYYLNNTVNYNTADNNGGGFFGEFTPAIYARNDFYGNQVGLAAQRQRAVLLSGTAGAQCLPTRCDQQSFKADWVEAPVDSRRHAGSAGWWLLCTCLPDSGCAQHTPGLFC